MVYQNKIVACVKVNGKVLREQSDLVTLPFGSEYSILVKNLNSVRVKVKVGIDGQDATEGTWLVVQPNSSIELERFIRDGNLESGNRFKFIERTCEIGNFRGIKPDDGLIRIEYQTEKVIPVDVPINRRYYNQRVPRKYDNPGPYWFQGGYITYTSGAQTQTSGNVSCSAFNMSECSAETERSSVSSGLLRAMSLTSDQGITVPGSESQQKFYATSDFLTYPSEVLGIRLRGSVDGVFVNKPLLVTQRLECSTCGKTAKSSHKFCSGCGTALVLI